MEALRLTADAFNALEVLDTAVRLRAAGDCFDLALKLDDDRGSVAAVLAAKICHSDADSRSRRAALEEIGNPDATIGLNPLIRFATMDLATKATMRDLAALARSVVFRSWSEMRRAVMDFDIVPASYRIEATYDDRVPEPVSREDPDGSVLIWAPDEPIDRLYLVLTAAVDTGRIVRVVCNGGDLANIPVEIVPIERAKTALARASVCVAASMSEPGTAIALAKWGIPLCATFTSGAYEWVDPVASYRSWNLASAASAIAFALGAPAPKVLAAPAARAVERTAPPNASLVTVVVRAKSGTISTATSDSIARQAHTACEALVANDARAVRDAVHAARGEYIVFVRDGDILFSESIAALVRTLEQSRADVAYGDALFGYLADASGAPVVFGYSVLERFPVSARAMAATDEFAGTYFRVLFRRSALLEIGVRDDLDDLAIYDALLRTLERTTAVRVDLVCGMAYRYLDGRSPGDAEASHAAEYAKIYASVEAPDAAGRAARNAVLQHLRVHARIGLRPPPQLIT